MGDITFNNTTPSQDQTLTTFSVDPASPAIDGSLTPDDVLEPDPSIFIPGTNLGLTDDFFNGLFDNLNALSYGRDPIQNPLYFSVDRVAIGLPETDVNSQAQPGAEEAHGDVYKTLPPFGNNSLFIDEQQLGLAPGFFGDDLDALDLDTQSNPEFTFFSVDFLSFPNSGKQDDILVNNINNVYADGASDIGIDEEDDLDALILFDVTPDGMGGFISEPNGILDPGLDQALFSLSTFSPSTFTSTGNSYNPGVKGFLSPADILKTDFTGDFSLWAAASELGLLPDDELDTLDTTVADVPEPLNFVITKDVNLNKTVGYC